MDSTPTLEAVAWVRLWVWLRFWNDRRLRYPIRVSDIQMMMVLLLLRLYGALGMCAKSECLSVFGVEGTIVKYQ